MSRVDDETVARIYDALKNLCQDTLRDDQNPNLAPVSFNQMRPPTLSHVLVHLTGLQVADTSRINRILRDFPFGAAELVGQEGPTGKMEWWIQVEIPRSHKKKHRHHHHHSYEGSGAPSCLRLMVSATVCMGLSLTALMTTDLSRLLLT